MESQTGFPLSWFAEWYLFFSTTSYKVSGP